MKQIIFLILLLLLVVESMAFRFDSEVSITINKFLPVRAVLTGTISNVSCPGYSDGTIDLMVSGGTAPYLYYWSNGDSTEDISSLAAGNYSVLVIDAVNDSSYASFTLTEPDPISLISVVTDASCYSYDDGSIDITVTGGTSPYSFSWSNLLNTEDISNLTAGSYSVIITDSVSCFDTFSFSVNEPSASFIIGSFTVGVTCYGSDDGSIDLTINGPSGYSFLWSNNATTEDLSGLSPGYYSVVVTDLVGGCSQERIFFVNEPDPIVLSSLVTDENNGNNGAIDLTVSGGFSPYQFDWDNDGTGDNDDTEDLTGLTGGNYKVIVTDLFDCVDSLTITVSSNIGISEMYEKERGIHFFPNPADDFIVIEPKDRGTFQISIADFSGKMVLEIKDEKHIKLTSLSPGIYYIFLKTEEGTIVDKLIRTSNK